MFLCPVLVLATAGALWNASRAVAANAYRELGMTSLAAAVYAGQVRRDVLFAFLLGGGLYAAGFLVRRWWGVDWSPYLLAAALLAALSRILYPDHWAVTMAQWSLPLPGFLWKKEIVAALLAAGILMLAALWLIRRRFPGLRRPSSPGRPVFLASLAGCCLSIFCLGYFGYFHPREMAPAGGNAPVQRLNVLWIALDALRADFVSAYGRRRGTSPHLDALAAEGVLFENAFSQASWTYPSFSTMFTSRPLAELPGGRLDLRAVTAAEMFQNAGYRTRAFVQNPNLDAEFQFHQGFGGYEQFIVRLGPRPVVARAQRYFLEALRENRPVFVFLHVNGVHYPFRADNPFLGQFAPGVKPEDIERANTVMIDNGFIGPKPPAETVAVIRRQIEGIYAAAVRDTDEAVGGLLEALRPAGALENTVIVVGADHGEEFGERGRFGHAGSNLHAEITRVPLILHLPKRFGLAGRRVAGPVMNLDILPTLLAVAGLRSPVPLAGSNLLDLIRQTPDRLVWSGHRSSVAVRNLRWTFHADYSSTPPRLLWYDRTASPWEDSPITGEPPQETKRLRLAAEMWFQKELTRQARVSPGRGKLSRELVQRLRSLGYLR